jgi:translation initiation factor IF-3
MPNVAYAVQRLGLVADPREAIETLTERKVAAASGKVRIVKLLIASEEVIDDRFYCVTLDDLERFFSRRFTVHETTKFRDRHFFPSELIQHLIHRAHTLMAEVRADEERKAKYKVGR